MFSKVRSITTDFGTELHSLEVPDVIAAFLAWTGGKSLPEVAHLIDPTTRLFPKSLRIGGWSHAFGGIAKKLMKLLPNWNKINDQLSALCKF